MQQCVKNYIADLNNLYTTGVAREHAYRVPFQNLMTALLPKGYTIVNEPWIACGAPEYIILHGDVPMAFMEAKDLKDRTLSFDDIAHYCKIITVLLETDRVMKEIDV